MTLPHLLPLLLLLLAHSGLSSCARVCLLLGGVRILPGRNVCSVVAEQLGTIYSGNTVPHLPLVQCTCDPCECKYAPIGTDRLRRLDPTGKSSPPKSR